MAKRLSFTRHRLRRRDHDLRHRSVAERLRHRHLRLGSARAPNNTGAPPSTEGIANGILPNLWELVASKVKIKRKQHLVRKQMDPVFSEEDRRNGPQTDGVTCPHCGHGKAIYHQAQIRSADEPMTTFYWCLNERCKKNWRED
ncbi:hypothetical protein NL676_007960 [Syzygium grande]|nr:hypothetical protein NL676_007960 [Syzygium grande]